MVYLTKLEVLVQGSPGEATPDISRGAFRIVGSTTGKERTRSQPVLTMKDAVEATVRPASFSFAVAGAALWERDASIKFAVCITEDPGPRCRVVATTPACIIVRTARGSFRPALARRNQHSMIFKAGTSGYLPLGTLTYGSSTGSPGPDLGQSTCVGIGGDPIIRTTFVDCLREFAHPRTTSEVAGGRRVR